MTHRTAFARPTVRRRTAAVARAGALLATLVSTQFLVVSASPSAQAVHGSAEVRQWVTDAHTTGSRLDTPTPVRTTDDAADTILQVDPDQRFQNVSGFGASITESSATVLFRMNKAERDRIMTELFDPDRGIGLSMLRQPIGASDFATHLYSFDAMPRGQTDYELKHFSIDHDRRQILPLLRQARKLNPKLRIIASPWSPPGWMKTNHSMIDGKLIDSPRIYDAYARYLVKFAQAYADAGVPVDYLTVQNEPQALRRTNYPGTDLPVAQEAEVIKRLGPALRRAGLHTRILGFDHNWVEHPYDVESHTANGADPELRYPYDLLESSAARWTSGTAYHCYYGDPSAQSKLRASFPDKDIFVTECSGGGISRTIGSLNHWSRSMVFWNLALDEKHGPHTGGCTHCYGVVTVDSASKAVTHNRGYYTLAHFARFVHPGASRVAVDVTPTQDGSGVAADDTDRLQACAFTDPDGGTALVVHNPAKTTHTFTIAAPGVDTTTTLAPGATATYTWDD